MPLALGTQQGRAPLAPGTQQGGAPLAPQAPGTQQGGAQIAVQPPRGGSAGPPQAPPGIGTNAPPTQEGSGIAGALERLAFCMTNADTSWSLRWQCNVNGDATKLAAWKVEATALPRLQFYANMQPNEAFLVVGHTLSTIYSTTTDVPNYHGKVIFFTGDKTATRKCVPVVLPPRYPRLHGKNARRSTIGQSWPSGMPTIKPSMGICGTRPRRTGLERSCSSPG